MDEMNNMGYQPAGDPETDKRAKNVKILGIVALVTSFCCTYAGIIIGIIGLVKANGLAALPEISDAAKGDVKVGKICSIIGLAIGAVTLVINIITMATGGNEMFNMLTGQ